MPHDHSHAPCLPLTASRRRFDHERELTVGVEEEVILLDPATFLAADMSDVVLRRLGGDPRFKPELRCAQLELATHPAATAADAARELAAMRRTLVETLEGEVRFMAAGTHPTSTRTSAVTAQPRYREIAGESRWLLRSGLPCGLHIHVAVGGADRALAVSNALRSYLPEITALAANSPYFEGADSGLASTRLRLTEDTGRAGMPPAFAFWRDYEEFVRWATRGGVIRDATYFWWDMRLNLQHGTIEIRAPDAQAEVDAAASIAALCQALVASLVARYDAGERLTAHDSHRIAENRWRAMRDGVDGLLVGLDDGEPIETRARLHELISELRPWAVDLACERELEHAAALVHSNGAAEQRRFVAAGDVTALPQQLADLTEAAASSRPLDVLLPHARQTASNQVARGAAIRRRHSGPLNPTVSGHPFELPRLPRTSLPVCRRQ